MGDVTRHFSSCVDIVVAGFAKKLKILVHDVVWKSEKLLKFSDFNTLKQRILLDRNKESEIVQYQRCTVHFEVYEWISSTLQVIQSREFCPIF